MREGRRAGYRARDIERLKETESIRNRLVFVIASIMVIGAVTLAGCGSSRDPASLVEDCRQAVDGYVQGGGYVHFLQESEYQLKIVDGEFKQLISVEGDIILPDRESYDYKETMSSSTQPEAGQENSFSYLTLDGGSMAYVKGERLSAELGVSGWVHYTPPAGQNRYFDYALLIEQVTRIGEGAELLGYEDIDGQRCAHIRGVMSGEELVEMRLNEDSTFADEYQGIDLGKLLGDLEVEVWIAEADSLPRRVTMGQSLSSEGSIGSSNRMDFVFSGYAEEAPPAIEAPAVFQEAE
jgi:hypothetical protein